MIFTRSPYYYNVPFPNDFVVSVDFTVIVGDGSLGAINPIETYEITKPRPGDDWTNLWIDIADFIRPLYNYTPLVTVGTLTPEARENNEVLLTSVTAEINDTVGSTEPALSNKYIATDGYGYYTEGQNFNPNKKILLSHTEYKADARGWFIVPLSCNASSPDPTINAVSVPLNYVDNANNYVKYLVIPMANYSGSVDVAFDGEAIQIELIEECKYDVNEIQFINKYGVFESIHFYKAKKETLTIQSESFKSAFTDGVSYDTKAHQIRKYNVTSNKRISIETGFLSETYNITIQELLQSEHVWKDGVPVNVRTESLELKTRFVDGLVSYGILFDYAYDEINNV